MITPPPSVARNLMLRYDTIYLDMDGVIADFSTHFAATTGKECEDFVDRNNSEEFWEELWQDPLFFRNIPPFPHMQELLRLITPLANRVTVLTAPARVNRELSILQKREWLDEHLSRRAPVIFEGDKWRFARPGRLLIDDYCKKCASFAAHGGSAVQFFDMNTLRLDLEHLPPPLMRTEAQHD